MAGASCAGKNSCKAKGKSEEKPLKGAKKGKGKK